MLHGIQPTPAAVVLMWAGCVSLHAEAADHGRVASGNTAAPHFWDAVPASRSTAMPRAIVDAYWHGECERVSREVAQADGAEIVFFGDSITWHWSLGSRVGQDVWKQEYSRFSPINMGNSGDITPVMLYRATHGNLDFPKGQQPKVAVLLCGTNNFVVTQSAGGKVQWGLGADCRPEDVAHGARAVAQVFRRRLPHTRVIMLGILPVSNTAKWTKCQQANAVNAALACDTNEVVFLDLQDKFVQSDGSIDKRLFTDGTHLTADGYRTWARSIEPVVSDMMKAKPLDPVRIMLVGDSITEGIRSSESYRRYLDGMLRREGHLIDFVGSRKRHNDDRTEPDNYEYDVDHEGHWGKDSQWLANNMPDLLDDGGPDVAVIHMGTEDIVSSTSAAGPLTDEIIWNIGQVISALRARNAAVEIVLAKILHVPGKAEQVDLLNLKISKSVDAYSSPRSPVVVADLYSGLNVSEDLADGGILPNATGARKMATVLTHVISDMVNGKGHR